MKYGNLKLGQIEALINKIGGMDVVINILSGVEEVTITTISYVTHTLIVLVDETKTVEQLTADGEYDWSNDGITSKNFPLPEEGKIEEREISLFHFNQTMTSGEVTTEMDKEGFRPATIHELLGLGISQSDFQREFPIIALDSVCFVGSRRHVTELYGIDDERGLGLRWFGLDWNDYYRFAGVRK